MEHSELFLLLPKYEDVEEQPEYIKSTNIMTEDACLYQMKTTKVIMMLKMCQLFFILQRF